MPAINIGHSRMNCGNLCHMAESLQTLYPSLFCNLCSLRVDRHWPVSTSTNGTRAGIGNIFESESHLAICADRSRFSSGSARAVAMNISSWLSLSEMMRPSDNACQVRSRRLRFAVAHHSFARVYCTYDDKDAPKDTISNPHQQSGYLLKNCVGRNIDQPRDQTGK